MEDQPTDTSDLTDTDNAVTADRPAPAVTPVGKRGRHRSFRPRPAPSPEAGQADAADNTAASSETTAAESTATAPPETSTSETVESEPAEDGADETTATAPAAKPKRRRWFRRRGAAEPTDEETTVTESPAEPEDQALDDTAVEAEPAEPAEEEREVKQRKPVGRRLTVAVAVAAALFVAAAAFGGAMLQPYLADRVVADTKVTIARTATDAIKTLFTYTPEDMEQLPERSAEYLGGDLADAYATQVDALVATNKQNQIHRNVEVVGAGVESLEGAKATAIVYANITYTSAANQDIPRMFLVSYRLSMQREGSDWVITNMPWITSKDLTQISP